MNDSETAVANNSRVYYTGRYWNNFDLVRSCINARLTGDPKKLWYTLFHELVGGRRFQTALFLNCGNGWVERELFQAGLFDAVIGLDYSEELLLRAQADAEKLAMPARYVQADINKVNWDSFEFDLVVNHAAAHHIQYIDRVFRAVARRLPADGFFLNMDYVGPHRNQYPQEQWEAMHALNSSLPAPARSTMSYPDARTMLFGDPTEAIHSELIVETFQRYFQSTLHTKAGGALAYHLLTHNNGIWSQSPADRDQVVAAVMAADGNYLQAHHCSSLFDFFFGSPRPSAKLMTDSHDDWSLAEESRETRAQAEGCLYHYGLPLLDRPSYFGATGWARTLIHCGFHEPEATGTWTDGLTAVLRFRAPEHQQLTLRLNCSPHVGAGLYRQRVFVSVNGLPSCSFEVSRPGDLLIPLPTLRDSLEVLLTLQLPDAISCDRLGTGRDARVLGIMVHQFELITSKTGEKFALK